MFPIMGRAVRESPGYAVKTAASYAEIMDEIIEKIAGEALKYLG
jgi:hypothetical protein